MNNDERAAVVWELSDINKLLKSMDIRMRGIFRMQAWHRAKGELQSILGTYYNEWEAYEEINARVEKFIDEIEGILYEGV